MTKKHKIIFKRRLLLMSIIIFLAYLIINFSNLIYLFNSAIDSETKIVMQEKLTFDEQRIIIFSEYDIEEFSVFIKNDAFKFDNLEYYQIFNSIPDIDVDSMIPVANLYVERNVSTKTIVSYIDSLDDFSELVDFINNGIDNDPNVLLVMNPHDLLVLVNNQNYLGTYLIKDLVLITTVPTLNDADLFLNADTYKALQSLCSAIENEFFGECGSLVVTSTFRDYYAQKELFNTLIAENPKNINYVAKPGFSEHHLGSALDMMTYFTAKEDFDSTEQFVWVKNNAHKYGFIIRYPKGAEDITGVSYESWHYRYVGVEAATIIYNKGITLEEYLHGK